MATTTTPYLAKWVDADGECGSFFVLGETPEQAMRLSQEELRDMDIEGAEVVLHHVPGPGARAGVVSSTAVAIADRS